MVSEPLFPNYCPSIINLSLSPLHLGREVQTDHSQQMPTMCSGTCQLPALSSIPWRTCRNPRRPLLTSSQAAAHQTDVKTQLSQEETQKALQYQIDRSTKQEPSGAAQQEQQPKEYEKDLVKRQRSAREWVTPWLVS